MIALHESSLKLATEPRNKVGLPAPALEHFRSGNALYLKGDFASAIQEYDAALTVQPELAEAYRNRGVALERLERHEEALREFDRAIQLQPDAAWAYYGRGASSFELEHYEDALADFQRAAELEPGTAVFHGGLGIALFGLRRYKEALDALQRSIELEPEFAETHAGYAGALWGLGRYQDALAAIDRAMALGEDNEETRVFRAEILKKLLRGLASGGKAAWLGRPPQGAKRPHRLKPGSPTVAEAILEDKR